MADPTPWTVGAAGEDSRKHAPATLRNRAAIAGVLQGALPAAGLILEVASGSGEHAAHFSRMFPGLVWQPSDPEVQARESVAAWCAGLANVRPALDLDAAAPMWPIERADAMLCINMLHISPWEATLGLAAGAERVLPPGAPLIVYGPFLRAGVPVAPSNAAFDESLRARDPAWGLRSVEAVVRVAANHRLALERIIDMPANNLSLVFRRG